jgi:predicted enzyme related to lactoylglutathione lyase
MSLKLKRVIVFTSKMDALTKFYGKQLGLSPRIDPRVDASEWIEFDAGDARVALHKAHGKANRAAGNMKLVFYAKDVDKARAALMRKKVKMGTVHRFGTTVMCDGRDPAGNRIQVSNRL